MNPLHTSLKQVCPPGLHITLGIFFKLFTLLEDSCHELDVRALLQGVNGGAAYEAYVSSYQREVDLADKCAQVKSQICTLLQQQLMIILTLTTTNPAPSHVTEVSQLSSAISDKRKELEDMVIEHIN